MMCCGPKAVLSRPSAKLNTGLSKYGHSSGLVSPCLVQQNGRVSTACRSGRRRNTSLCSLTELAILEVPPDFAVRMQRSATASVWSQ